MELAEQLEKTGTRLVTTRAVQLEIGNALSKQRYRHAAIRLLDSLEADPMVKIIPLSEKLYAQALQLYRERQDKEGIDRLHLLHHHDQAKPHRSFNNG